MKQFIFIIFLLRMSITAHSQFTIIPTGTASSITDIVLHNDTLIISGNNYFAKSYDMGATVTPFIPPGLSGYTNFDLQVINDNYYILSIEESPYEHNQVLKSTDYGTSWSVLYDTTGLFYTLTMSDSSFGVMGGSFGNYAMTQDNDTSWIRDTLFSLITSSASFGDSTMIMLSILGSSFITKDRGQTWNWGYCNSSEHTSIQYINKDTVYSVSTQGTGNQKGYFSYSINGGYNFSTVNLGYNFTLSQYEYYSRVYDLYFDTPKHGYMIGYIYIRVVGIGSVNINQGTIFETNDYGQTWTPYLTGFNEEFYSLLNVNDSIAFIGGENGLLIKWNKNISLTTILSVNNIEKNNSINIFPNPLTNTARITLQRIDLPETMFIYDHLGRLVRTESIINSTHIFERKNLISGIYYYSIGSHNGKIIITQ